MYFDLYLGEIISLSHKDMTNQFLEKFGEIEGTINFEIFGKNVGLFWENFGKICLERCSIFEKIITPKHVREKSSRKFGGNLIVVCGIVCRKKI